MRRNRAEARVARRADAERDNRTEPRTGYTRTGPGPGRGVVPERFGSAGLREAEPVQRDELLRFGLEIDRRVRLVYSVGQLQLKPRQPVFRQRGWIGRHERAGDPDADRDNDRRL